MHLHFHDFFKVLYLKACNFIKKRLQHRRFPVTIAKFLRLPILKNICERWQLLFVVSYSDETGSTFCTFVWNLICAIPQNSEKW